LQDKAPKEASVYFQIGKIYRRLDQTDKALMYFSTALDLKPSSSDINMIKSAIEKLKISNESDEEEI
jgi:anaphase-promoting complex subunit 3